MFLWFFIIYRVLDILPELSRAASCFKKIEEFPFSKAEVGRMVFVQHLY